jgi:hypothetical protein
MNSAADEYHAEQVRDFIAGDLLIQLGDKQWTLLELLEDDFTVTLTRTGLSVTKGA